MTTVHNISGIKDIAILWYNGNVSYVTPSGFNSSIGELKTDNDWEESENKCTGKMIRPLEYYKITDANKLISDSNNAGTGNVFVFNKEVSAAHARDSSWLYSGCTRFWNLFSNDRMTIEKKALLDKGFKVFNNDIKHPTNWIGHDSTGRHDNAAGREFRVYWRVFYRTWDSYYDLIKCNNIFEFDSYLNNSECKNYINNQNFNVLTKACIDKQLNESQLWDICMPLLSSDKVDGIQKAKINDKLINYCKQSDKLAKDPKCNRFWNTSYNNYYTQAIKATLIDPHATNLCKPGTTNIPFCNCIINEKHTLKYYDSAGNPQTIHPSCLSSECAGESYKLSDHNEKRCPNACIQTVLGTYATIKGVNQTCNMDSEKPKTNSTEPSNTNQSNTNTTTPTTPKPVVKTNLFGLKNDKIRELTTDITKKIDENIKYPIDYANYLLSEEDIFILTIILFMFVMFILNKVFNSGNRYDYDDDY